MSDQWFDQHANAVHGPVFAEQLLDQVGSGGLHRDDLIWPECLKAVVAIPAAAARTFPTPGPVEPRDFEPAPAPLPEWVCELREAIAAGGNLTNLPPPSAQAWRPDVRDAEQKAQHGE